MIKREISFKVIKSKDLYVLTSQKSYPREMYGKFITIYPKDIKEFKKIIKDLYRLLREYEGPRILSDRRYKEDCKVLYYRYGGLMPYCKYDTLGSPHYYIKDDHGNYVEDVRTPYYENLYFIKDPFRMEKLPKSKLLKQYQIIEVIDYKNSGGIYLAQNNAQKYVIKEARPYTMLVSGDTDAIKIRMKEAELISNLKGEKCIPKLKDAFMDSEHFFLIEEYCEGDTLYEYSMFYNSYLRNDKIEKVETYLCNLIDIFIELAAFLARMEKRDIIICDFSADNIIVTENNEIKLVDLEGAALRGEEICISKDINRSRKSIYYDFCKLFFFCLFGKAEILEINQNYMDIFWSDLKGEYSGVTDTLYDVFNKIYNGQYSSFDEVERNLKNLSLLNKKLKKKSAQRVELGRIERFVGELYTGIINSKNNVNGMIYPCVPFVRNEYNISNGSTGIEFALSKITGENLEIESRCYQVWGLYTGAAGIMWAMVEKNMIPEAEQLADKLMAGKYEEKDISFYSGLSGIATALLRLYFCNGDDRVLTTVLKMQEKIEKLSVKNDIKDRGIKFGRTGISIFYLYLYLATDNESFLQEGKSLLVRELEYLIFRDDGKIDLQNTEGGTKASPYFLEGTAGLLAVLVRYYYICRDVDFEQWIYKLTAGIDYNQILSCTLFYGNAGIGNVFLDCYYCLNDRKYLEKAMEIARKCCLYEYKMSKGGSLVPDVFNTKLSADWGYGAAGVMLFLNRLCKKERSNFCFFIDEAMKERKTGLCTRQY